MKYISCIFLPLFPFLVGLFFYNNKYSHNVFIKCNTTCVLLKY